MAEQIKIAELSIDNEKLLNSLQSTKKTIEELTATQKKLKASGEENSKTFIQNEAQLKSLKTEYGKQIKVLQVTSNANAKLNVALKKEINSIDEAKQNNAELVKVRNQLNTKTEEGAKALKEINDRIDENNGYIKKNTSALEKQKQNVGNYEGALKKARLGAVSFGSALKALGIGLIVAAVAKLTEAFGRNQKIANVVSTVFNAIGIVFDKIVGTLVDTVSAVNEATGGFDALGRIMKNLLTLSLTPIQVAFYGIKAGITGTQLIWEKSFLGGNDSDKIKQLQTDLDNTNKKITELGTEAIAAGINIVNDFGEAFNEVATLAGSVTSSISNIDFSNVVKDAKELTDIKNNIEALIITQEGLVQKYEREAEILRQKRDDESNSLEDRKKANEQLGAKLEEQAAAERKLIATRLSAAQKEAGLNKGNIDLQNEVLRIKNEVLDVENRIEGQRSEKLANDNSLRNEELTAIKDFETKKREIADKIALAKLEDEQARESQKIQQEYDKQVAELETLKLNEQQKTDLLLLLQDDRDLQLAGLKSKTINKEIEDEEKLAKTRLALREKTLDGIAALAGAETGIGKAALIAKQVLALKEHALNLGLFTSKASLKASEAGVDIAAGTAKSASAAPFPFNLPLIIGFVASVAGIISSIKSATNKGKSTKLPKAANGLLVGNSHLQGGIHIEAEGGEAIINKRSTAKYRTLLSAINESGGGVKFANGGIAGATTSPSNTTLIDYNKIALAVAQLPPPIVSVEEISSVANRINVIESQASF